MNLDAEVSKYTGDGGVVSLDEMERRITENVLGDYDKHGFGRLALELKGENSFIGFTGLKYLEDMDEVDLGYRFSREYWGKGYATEAGRASLHLGFKILELDRIIATVLPENVNSISVLKKLDFEFEKNIVEDGLQAELYAIDKKTALFSYPKNT